MAKENKPESIAENDKPSVDNEVLNKLIEEMNELKALVKNQQEIIDEKDKTFENLKSAIEEQNKRNMKKLPDDVIEREKSMRDKVMVFISPNALDPKNTHVPVLNPITNKTDKVIIGEHVEVNRAVYEVLQHSMESDKKYALIASELSEKFEKDTENL